MSSFVRRVLLSLCLAVTLTAQADPQLNQPMPRIDTPLLGGKVLKANDLNNKVVLVVFWATWCPVCLIEMPLVQRLYDNYKDKGLEVLALSMDIYEADATDFWKQKGFTYPLAMRLGAVKQTWGSVNATPQMLLADRKGIMKFKHLGIISYEEMEAQVKPLL